MQEPVTEELVRLLVVSVTVIVYVPPRVDE
jgi:hypothetical protein